MKKLFFYLLCVTVFCQYSCGSNAVAGSQEGQEKLANGMTIETYRIKKTIDLKDRNSLCGKSQFDYEIDWPVDGPQPLLNKCRRWILQQLNGNENHVNGELSVGSLSLAIEERIKNNSTSYNRYDEFIGTVDDRIEIKIKADDAKTCLTSHIEELPSGGQRYYNIDATCYLLNSGEEMTYSMFPPIEKMRPFIWSHLLNWDEPVECAYGNNWDIEYPEQLPEIIDDNFVFQWPVSNFENLTATIPISEVYPILSAQLRKFLPKKYAEDSEANADSNHPRPTRELLFSYGNEGVINENNEYISKEFRELIKLAALLPSDYPCGIGSYDEILYFWQGIDLDGSAVYDAQILSVSDNQALGVVTFGSKEFNKSHKVTLIKEKFVDPDGKTAPRWVVDDYEDDYNGGKKKLLKETINEAGEAFSQGLGQRLMNDPEVGGDMTESAKREYLQQVDEFLKAYKEFKSTKKYNQAK